MKILLPFLALGSLIALSADPSTPITPRPPVRTAVTNSAPVTRAEFNALKIEVARLKAAQNAASRRSTNPPAAPPVRKSIVSPK